MAKKTTRSGRFFITIGVFFALAGALHGIFSLTYYGLGFSREPSAYINIKNGTWAKPVRVNIQKTYIYLFVSFYICVVTAFYVFSHPILLEIFSSLGFVIVDMIVETMVNKGRLFSQLNSRGVFSIQKIAWTLYCVFLGALSSTYLLNGKDSIQISLRISFGIILALILLSLSAPLKKYYNLIHFSDNCCDIVAYSSVGAALIPVKYSVGALFFSVSLYGGLVAFPLNFLSHAQEAHVMAAQSSSSYCPPAMCIPLLLNTLSFFARIVLLLIH